ncbi:chorismate synthase [Clostridium tetanomorphum]|uniref:Chorismate synthase n=1 Tax=Clostridium tetanomorphum TaxID=1553 RepID=A0A923E4V5_CLOTT|nr:chorismate synthase [Clostridium tetanomorphum]KAJ51006.1 chorismate synthase [Clostridium tetanomorphum DSM 665]MBC2396373.1 chorismate synthase [Clostridium tetanomorphum]MBP1863398.1 chorismate synthase [Clostridium tetanomorphum]NRS83495.1 chorismate synthase [Clostridium tetanomorphum]NRZ96695.1 chorismate synthase [Clostridium tetanomorphum]
MSAVWGNNIKLSIFGESHGKAIGINIDGLPSGVELDLENIKMEMSRRAPGKDKISTARNEKDEFQILSGYFNNRTTGTPLCVIIPNSDQHSKDYEKMKNIVRPSHGDFPGNVKYSGYNDYRGGGHFSGRITAPIVFAGAIAKQILKDKNIIVGSHIKSIGNINDDFFNKIDIKSEILEELRNKKFPVIKDEKAEEMQGVILKAKEELDSVGGTIETAVINIPAGIGEPFFHSVESSIAHMIFSIPGVKGIEFGEGFNIAKFTASQANDEYYIKNNEVKTYTNNNGGILGGITNGMPIIFTTAMKPTPSIGKIQNTIDIEKKKNIQIKIEGRHDPCIVPRAVPVIEGATALVILDLLMERKSI